MLRIRNQTSKRIKKLEEKRWTEKVGSILFFHSAEHRTVNFTNTSVRGRFWHRGFLKSFV